MHSRSQVLSSIKAQWERSYKIPIKLFSGSKACKGGKAASMLSRDQIVLCSGCSEQVSSQEEEFWLAPHREQPLSSVYFRAPEIAHICLVLRAANHTSFHANILNINIYRIIVYTIYNYIYNILYILYIITYTILYCVYYIILYVLYTYVYTHTHTHTYIYIYSPGEASSWGAYIIRLFYQASQTREAMPSCHTLTFQWSMETEKPSVCLPRTEIYFTDLKGPWREHSITLNNFTQSEMKSTVLLELSHWCLLSWNEFSTMSANNSKECVIF